MNIDDIEPAPYNPRKDLKPGDREYEALIRSVSEFGFVEPLVWNRRTTVFQEVSPAVQLQRLKDGVVIKVFDGERYVFIEVPEIRNVEYETQETTSVWELAKEVTKTYVHPNQKPVALVERAIRNSSKPGELVLDLFGGSGSTLLAAEKAGRVCFLMELDPKFCDVIVQRWELLTGKKAEVLYEPETETSQV